LPPKAWILCRFHHVRRQITYTPSANGTTQRESKDDNQGSIRQGTIHIDGAGCMEGKRAAISASDS